MKGGNRIKVLKLVEDQTNGTLHRSMKFSLLILQIFGYFPANGITNNNSKNLKFSWSSSVTIYAIITLIFSLFLLITRIYSVFFDKTNLNEFNDVVFRGSCIFSSILFIKLAREWPEFVKFWHNFEMYQGNNYGNINTNLQSNIKIIVSFFLTYATFEHLLLQTHNLYYCVKCTRTLSEAFQQYFVFIHYTHVFRFIDYSLWKGLLLLFVNTQMTFIWSFVDVFIIVISLAYTARLQVLLKKLEFLINNRVESLLLWKNLREEHNYLNLLCLKLNNTISLMVIQCFSVNLYFTLVQLYGSVELANRFLWQKIYYFVSFSFLIVRTICVCLYAATVDNENRKILPLLLTTPSDIYNVEIQRFIKQSSLTNLAISGKNFFVINKGIILNIAGSLVTYELVLIQFHNVLHNSEIDMNLAKKNISTWIC